MEAQAETAQSGEAGGLLTGPPAFVNHTPWRPWSGLAVAVAITVAAMGFSAALLISGITRGTSVAGDTVGIGALGAWQALVILLTLLVAFWRGRPWATLSLGPPRSAGIYLGAILAVLVFQLVTAALEYVFVPEEMFRDLRQFVSLAQGPAWLLVLVVVGLGAPLSEELLFRGFLLPALARGRLGFRGAAVVSTALWTMLHAGYSIVGLAEVFLIGLLFSWLLWRTGSLRVTIVCHALYNSLIMLVLRFAPLPAALTGG